MAPIGTIWQVRDVSLFTTHRPIAGGMQDYNYRTIGCLEITIEMGCWKYPHADLLRQKWVEHRHALLRFIEMVTPTKELNE